MSRIKPLAAITAAIYLTFIFVSNTFADTTIINVSGGSNWRTTTNVLVANQWNLGNFSDSDGVAATAPYGNTATTTLNTNRMMWNCGADGMTQCLFDTAGNALGTGPSPAYFGYSFELIPGASVTNGGIAIIADDFFRLFINGDLVLEELLADNVDINNQPVPVILDFATLSPFFQSGTNVITVGAEDFGGGEYLFISGSLEVEVAPITIDVSGGSNWRTTTDVLVANQWNLGNFSNSDGVAATAPYGNTSTTVLNTNRMMWNCGADGMTGCSFDMDGNALGTGPSPAYFGFSFDMHPAKAVTNGGIAIIADDIFRLFINGALVSEGLLSDNVDINNQPIPIVLGFDTLSPFFQSGTNIITAVAEDIAGPEYLFISGSVRIEVVDADGDLITDSEDNCILVSNPDQRDTNGDGYGNSCDPDIDNNGIVNFGDVAMWVPFFNTANTGDVDFNGDGFANFGDYSLFSLYFLRPPGPSGLAP